MCLSLSPRRAKILTITSEEPLALAAASIEVHHFFAVQGVCKGYHLPGEAEEPWKWSAHWLPIVTEGAAIGEDFVRGMQISSVLRGNPTLSLEGKLGGDRATALAAVGQLLTLASAVDLSGNELTDAEVAALCPPIESASKLTKLKVLSNALTPAGVAALKQSVAKSSSSPELCLQAFDADGKAIEGAGEEAAAGADATPPSNAPTAADEEAKAKAKAKAAADAEAAAKAAAEAEAAKAAEEAAAKAAAEAEAAAKAQAEAAAKAEEEARFLEEAKEAAAAAAKRAESSEVLPPEYNTLAQNVRDVIEAACFHAFVQQRGSIKSTELEMATLTVAAPAELATLLGANPLVGGAGEKRSPAELAKARADAISAAWGKLPTGMRELKKEVRQEGGEECRDARPAPKHPSTPHSSRSMCASSRDGN